MANEEMGLLCGVETGLRDKGLKVNILAKRPSLLEHLADVQDHRCLVCGDSLPMHLALGTGTHAFPFLPAPAHGKYTGTGFRKKSSRRFWKSFFINGDTIGARQLLSPSMKCLVR